MHEIGAFEAKNKLGSLLDRVERGEEVVITRHGKAVARLVPNVGRVDQSQSRSVFQRIRARAKKLQAKTSKRGRSVADSFDWEALKQWRDQGRP
jgi:prevent-host-death family protein